MQYEGGIVEVVAESRLPVAMRLPRREADTLTADTIKNKNLVAAIKREGVTIYERNEQ